MNNTNFYNAPLHQGLALVTAPTAEPVTLAEAKLWIRQETDFTADDLLISSLITAARTFAETKQKRQIMAATFTLSLDQFPQSGSWSGILGAPIYLLPKISGTPTIVYKDSGGNSVTLDPSRYVVDTASQPGRVCPTYSQPWPSTRAQAGAVAVTFVAGYASAALVPEATKTAIKLLVAHWYRNRESNGDVSGPMELAVDSLLSVDAVGSYS